MPTDPSFRMTVEDVFSIAGRGTVVTGQIEAGAIRTGDEIVIRSEGPDKKATVGGVEAFKKVLQEAKAGDNVGILLKGIGKADVARGFQLLSPDLAR